VSADKKILYAVDQSDSRVAERHADFVFWCPGCGEAHGVWTRKKNSVDAVWSFNGDMEKPTFEPSLLIRGTRKITDEEHAKIMAGVKVTIADYVCHSFVRNGRIQYLSDCTHSFAGQTIPMEAF